MTFTPPALGKIEARTLIVHGDRDEFFPVSMPVQMYESIPGSELWIVPGGDHVPIFEERTAEFLECRNVSWRGRRTLRLHADRGHLISERLTAWLRVSSPQGRRIEQAIQPAPVLPDRSDASASG